METSWTRGKSDYILAYQRAVAKNGNAVADLIYLIQEVGNEDDAHTLFLQVTHQAEELFNLLLIQRGSRLIQNQNLTFHIHSAGNGYHLLHCNGTGAKLLLGLSGDAQTFQKLPRQIVHPLPVGNASRSTADEHILCHRQVGAEGNLLIYCADTRILGILWGADKGSALHAFNKDFTAVFWVDAGQNLNQGGFSRAVLAHQSVNFSSS